MKGAFALTLTLFVCTHTLFGAADSLSQLESRWNGKLAGANLPDSSAEKYDLKLSIFDSLLKDATPDSLLQIIKESAAAGATGGEFHEFLRRWILARALATGNKPLAITVMTGSPPESMQYVETEYYLVWKLGVEGVEMLLKALESTGSDWARERMNAMLRRAFPGLGPPGQEDEKLVKAARLWLSRHEGRIRVAKSYYFMNGITGEKRPKDPKVEEQSESDLFEVLKKEQNSVLP